ncbi:hypothetical protein GE09DRAFT_1173010 [Coniochaeta sp. 2T2.1]|nr:hypothetical protein GE09DRAFT_1173010 [Coniochaeta sp. 2T2.1]
MCDYTQREYSGVHFRWIVSRWCRDYTLTHRRYQPNVTHFEYRSLCGKCKPKTYPPWENIIKRTNKHTYTV